MNSLADKFSNVTLTFNKQVNPDNGGPVRSRQEKTTNISPADKQTS
jgi:hypothetical protein